MKLIFTNREMVEAQNMVDSIVAMIKEMDPDYEENISLVEGLKEENEFFTAYVNESGVELDIREDLVVDIMKCYEFAIKETAPLMVKLCKVIEPISTAIQAVMNVFSEGLIKDLKAGFGNITDYTETLFNKYL